MKFYKNGFTLAEIMIVLTIIGVLSAILLPTAFHSAPDENLAKFKQANATLASVVRQLVSSDKYYSPGNLGKYPDGITTVPKDYFCKTFSDLVSTTNETGCTKINGSASSGCAAADGTNVTTGILCGSSVTPANIDTIGAKTVGDGGCRESESKATAPANSAHNIIVTSNKVVYYEAKPDCPFGFGGLADNVLIDSTGTSRTDSSSAVGFVSPRCYKIICVDVDGTANSDVAPYAYALRSDGKLIPGARAQLDINKGLSGDD